MFLPFRLLLLGLAFLTGILTSVSVFAAPEIFDRLDGKGPSKKRVDVIEWEGNLEIHVYPKGSLKGLSVKLDERTSGKKVMVIGYRFGPNDRPLIRRAILGVPFSAKLNGFVDSTEKDFDKIGISNQILPAPWKPYKFDPAPKQWYPDGDERNDPPEAEPIPRRPASERLPEDPKKPLDEGSLNHFSW
jgi:hypothetical protein